MLALLFMFVLGAVVGTVATLCLLLGDADTDPAAEAARARAEIRAIRWETIARMLELSRQSEREARLPALNPPRDRR